MGGALGEAVSDPFTGNPAAARLDQVLTLRQGAVVAGHGASRLRDEVAGQIDTHSLRRALQSLKRFGLERRAARATPQALTMSSIGLRKTSAHAWPRPFGHA